MTYGNPKWTHRFSESRWIHFYNNSILLHSLSIYPPFHQLACLNVTSAVTLKVCGLEWMGRVVLIFNMWKSLGDKVFLFSWFGEFSVKVTFDRTCQIVINCCRKHRDNKAKSISLKNLKRKCFSSLPCLHTRRDTHGRTHFQLICSKHFCYHTDSCHFRALFLLISTTVHANPIKPARSLLAGHCRR